MREIKFRAWYNGKMLNNIGTLEFFEGGLITVNDGCLGCKLMQFTGFKDIKDKEIFEGDILLRILKKKDTGEIFHKDWVKVEYFEDGFRLVWLKEWDIYPGYFKQHRTHLTPLIWDFEIIGNIFENPELLK